MFGMADADDTKFIHWLLILFSCLSSCFGSDLDVQCLKTVKESMVDPNGRLKSWTNGNQSSGFICQFAGVECWHPDENRVLALRLSNFRLQGQFPQGLENCTSMTGLDLSSNNFSGPIPSDIARQMPYLTSLDLSYNSFSGEIPVGISNIRTLNAINLQHNQLSGQIPGQFNLLERLVSFSVADNLLTGAIPSALEMKFPASSFAGNLELCDTNLNGCGSISIYESSMGMIGAAVGFVAGFVVAVYFPHCFVYSRRLHPYFFRIC